MSLGSAQPPSVPLPAVQGQLMRGSHVVRQTHTYATLEVSAAAYDEIADKLKHAGYAHAFMREVGARPEQPETIDMHGIGLVRAVAYGETPASQSAIATNHDRVVQLAHDMASYVHHSGYPRYDGGHSEPEAQCTHPDCAAVRAAQLKTTDYAQYLKNFPNDEPRD